MRTVQLDQWGIENVHAADAADPVPTSGEVLIAAEAATINPADPSMVSGQFASWLSASITAPYTPGWDLAGRITPLAREFSIEQARAAYEEFASGPHRGRIVLTF
jgi:NADPH:quinone reductase-like Zn-dependent oxidoreductase